MAGGHLRDLAQANPICTKHSLPTPGNASEKNVILNWTQAVLLSYCSGMAHVMVMQGRQITPESLELIRGLLISNPNWNRTRLSRELCARWNWRNALGRPKDMAARTLLLKLERAGHIRLPARRVPPPNERRNRGVLPVAPPRAPIRGALRELRPLCVAIVAPGSDDARLFNGLLAHEHYLGHRNTVGENLRYLARDRQGRPVACVLFGSAAWKCADRDAFIGWDAAQRQRNLQLLTNNTRFLIPACVQVPHPCLRRDVAAGRWPVMCSGALPGAFAPTGRPSMGIPCRRWKPLWIEAGSKAPATEPPTGCGWARPKGAAATTGKTASGSRSKTCIFTR